MALKTPDVRIEQLDFKKIGVKAILIGISQDKIELSSSIKRIDAELGNIISNCIKNKDFNGEKGEVISLYNSVKNNYLILVGLGEQGKITLDLIANTIAGVLRALRDKGISKIGILFDSFIFKNFDDAEAIEKIAVSSLIGLYRYDEFKTSDTNKLKYVDEIKVLTLNYNKKYDAIIKNAGIISNAVNKTRALVATPPNIATPEYVASYAKGIAKSSGLRCTIIEEEEARKLGMNCFLAVAKGSANKPKFVILEYNGGKGQHVVLVGKGVTFDSGGLNIKTHPYMQNMKDDKSGAVAVIHVIEACSLLKLPINVIAIAPLCENMPSGTSYRPDDVIKSYLGVTVEIRNTDAEGRMILCDALAYSLKYKPEAIIDVATLTGAAKIVLGETGTPIMGNNPNLISKIKKASEKSLEKVWEMPLWEEYADELKSDIADMKHLSDEGNAGTIIGGTFLKNFIGSTPWAHMDIAITSLAKADKGVNPKGPTGVSVRLLIELLRGWR